MKKILKIGMYLISISSLATLVFFGSIFTRTSRQDGGNGTGLKGLLPFLGLGVDHAQADVPGGTDAGGDFPDTNVGDCDGSGGADAGDAGADC